MGTGTTYACRGPRRCEWARRAGTVRRRVHGDAGGTPFRDAHRGGRWAYPVGHSRHRGGDRDWAEGGACRGARSSVGFRGLVGCRLCVARCGWTPDAFAVLLPGSPPRRGDGDGVRNGAAGGDLRTHRHLFFAVQYAVPVGGRPRRRCAGGVLPHDGRLFQPPAWGQAGYRSVAGQHHADDGCTYEAVGDPAHADTWPRSRPVARNRSVGHDPRVGAWPSGHRCRGHMQSRYGAGCSGCSGGRSGRGMGLYQLRDLVAFLGWNALRPS